MGSLMVAVWYRIRRSKLRYTPDHRPYDLRNETGDDLPSKRIIPASLFRIESVQPTLIAASCS
jgi:hypothetical protein